MATKPSPRHTRRILDRKLAKKFNQEYGRLPTREELNQVKRDWIKFQSIMHEHQCSRHGGLEQCLNENCKKEEDGTYHQIVCDKCWSEDR